MFTGALHKSSRVNSEISYTQPKNAQVACNKSVDDLLSANQDHDALTWLEAVC